LELIFFTPTNLNPQYRSNCKGIFLSTVTVIEKHGIDKVLEPLVDDLKFLATTGISVTKGFVHAALLAFHDDNLASHYIGINRNDILNTVSGFSVAKGLPQDIMHDLLEGVLNFQLKLFIKHCIRSKYFVLQLNKRIKSFDYVHTLSNQKPPPSQRQIIPECDVHYHYPLLVIKILAICLAPVVPDNVVAYLRVLIEEHHQLFREICKDENFIPKLHYLVYYPNQMLRHGPLVRSWTM
uniref:Uncharacterized protein n=1 Tax=Amphimedon queenslandica TaxID=400682 RepID=A0A1X7VRK7_AMPQE